MLNKQFAIFLTATILIAAAGVTAVALHQPDHRTRYQSSSSRSTPSLTVTPVAFHGSSHQGLDAEVGVMCRNMGACLAPGENLELVTSTCTRVALDEMGPMIHQIEQLDGLPMVVRALHTLNARCAGECSDVQRCYNDGMVDAMTEN